MMIDEDEVKYQLLQSSSVGYGQASMFNMLVCSQPPYKTVNFTLC